MDSMSRRSSSRIATKKSLATIGPESLTTANQDPPVAPNPEPASSFSPRVRGGNKRKAVSISSPTGSHDKKLRRAVADTTRSKGASVDASEDVAPPVENGSDAKPGGSTGRPITPSRQEYPEKPIASSRQECPEKPVTPIPQESPEKPIAPIPQESPEKPVTPIPQESPETPIAPIPQESPEKPIAPSPQECPEKPWVPPVIERRDPLVNRFESLITPENFNLLTSEQKRKLYTLLPGFDREVDDSESSRPNGNLDSDILPPFWNDTRFRTQLSTIGERLAQGKYSQNFRDQIDSIMRRRADDEFQFMKDRAMESFWGQKKEIINPALAGQAASIKLTTMARHHIIRVNDVLCLRRQFLGYKLIEKHAIVTAVDRATGIMQLSYPPAQMRKSVAAVEDKTLHDVHSPGQIERILLEENGTGPEKPPNGNSFKNITVLRGGEELGTLFILRAQFFLAYLPPIEGAGPSTEDKKSATSRSRKAPESSRLARSAKSDSPLNKTHTSSGNTEKNEPGEEMEEVVEKTITGNCSPAVKPSRSSPRHLQSKIATSVSPVGETHPGDKHKDEKAPEEQKAPATRTRRALRKR